ncbi:hypothetical protein [Mycolicibacterium sp.]|uniref:hypothetical protein n=1 Tax=Mycolicibacterium sp. TaxID=2320850 RepID=UPI0028A9135C|nr:hypothetical protein [Mycolicibacterium sp.]
MRHVVQLVLAAVAAAGAVLCWLNVTSLVDVPPVTDGQPATVSVVYNPPLMFLVWLLATTAGVLAVLGVAGLRRRRAGPILAVYTP